MDFYFISEINCYLKINGEYIGQVGKNLCFVKDVDENSFFEFLPLDSDYYSLYGNITNGKNIKVYNMYKDKLIIPVFTKKSVCNFKLLGQKTFFALGKEGLITVLIDGFCKFYIDGFINHVENLPFIPKTFDVFSKNELLFISFTNVKSILFCYNVSNNNIQLMYKDIVDSFSVDDFLKVKKFYNLIIPVNILQTWNLSSPITINESNSKFEKSIYQINKKLLPAAFFELASVKADLSNFLNSNLKERMSEIYEFINSPIFCFPSYKNIEETIVVTKNSLNIYSLEFEGSLISNIKEIDF